MISVIIPVYNVEDTLHVCINSILKQTFQEFEIICIDNSSTDSSLEILEYFAQKDNRVKIISNEDNLSLGSSLNTGIEASHGEYILFLESNTWFNLDALETLFNEIKKNNLEILLFNNYYDMAENFEIENYYDYASLNKFEHKYFNHWDLDKTSLFKISYNLFNKLYSKSFLDENNIRFPIEILNHSDFPFSLNAMLKANKVSFINKYLLNKQNQLDFIIKYDNKQLSDCILISNLILDIFLKNKEIYRHYKKEVLTYIFKTILFKKYSKINETYKDKFLFKVQILFSKFIKDYGLYEDIKENVDENILNYFKFEEIIVDLLHPKPKISVIIPMYNVEKYLKECLDSVLNQSFNEIEIICVNDGSTDDSLKILESYADKDDRIIIINQENNGPGFARNVGLNHAIGEYILFIDSDDFISEDSLKILYENANSNNSDLIFFKFTRFNENEFNYNLTGFPLDNIFGDKDYDNFTFNYKDIKRHVLNSSFAAWAKLYKREFLIFNNINFPEGITQGEDVIFHIKTLLKAKSLSFIPEFLYNYRISNQNSIIHNRFNVWNIFEVCDSVEEFLKDSGYYNEFELEFLIFKITQLSQYISFSEDNNYFLDVKNEFLEVENDADFNIDELPNYIKNIFNKVLNSNNIKEFIIDENTTDELKDIFSKEFFIIDSHNLDEIIQELYGYILQSDGTIISNEFISGIELTGMGAYIIIELINNNIIISQDYNGSYGLYIYQEDGYFAISNSFIKLVDTIKINHQISYNENYANAFLFSDVCSFAYEETLVNEIKLLPRNLKIIIDKINKTIKFEKIDYKEYSLRLDSKEGIETLDKWFFKWVNIMRFVKSKTNNFLLNLSGGFDTRMILALALNANIDLNKICIFSFDDDLHTHKEDFKIASELANRFNFQLNKNVLNDNKVIYSNIAIPVNNSFYLKLGFHNQMYFKPYFFKEPMYSFAGSGDIRGFPDNTTEEYLNELINRVKNYDNSLVDSSISIIESSWNKLCEEFDTSLDYTNLTQIHYKEVRNRYHFGKAQVEAFFSNNLQLNPLLDPTLHKIQLTTEECDDKLLLTTFILVRYYPELLDFEFEGGRAINENTLKYAQNINKKFKFKPKEFDYISGPEVILNEIPYTEECDVIYDIENYFKKIAYSKSFELEFKKYFSNNAYNQIISQVRNLKYHPLSPFYAALAILKIINDVQFNKSLLSRYDLNYFNNYLEMGNSFQDSIEPSLKLDLSKYVEARIDIKNFGENNNVEIVQISDGDAKQTYPSWFKDEQGSGLVIQSVRGTLDLEIKCINDGKLVILLRGIDFRDKNNNRFPIYINYTDFTVNDEKLTENSLVSHNKPFKFEKKVKNYEIIKLHFEWRGMNSTAVYEP